jgi:hypothetical protein
MIDRTFGLFLSPLLSAAFLIIALTIIITERKINPSALRFSFLLFLILLSAAISFIFTEIVNQTDAVKQIYKYSIYAVMPIVLAGLSKNRRELKIFLILIFTASLMSYFFAIYQGLSGRGLIAITDDSLIRSFGFSSHPVLFGVQIVLVTSLFLYSQQENLIKVNKYLSVGFYFISMLALFLSFARTAWVMMLLVFIAHFLKNMHRYSKLLILFSIPIMFLFLGDSILERFRDIGSLFEFIYLGEYSEADSYKYINSSMHWRVVQWYNLILVGLDNFYLGVGPSQVENYNIYELSSHSSFVEFFVEQGMLGLTFYVVYIFWLFLTVFKRRKTKGGAIVFAVVIAFILGQFFSISFYNQFLNMLIFISIISFSISLKTFNSRGVYPSRMRID